MQTFTDLVEEDLLRRGLPIVSNYDLYLIASATHAEALEGGRVATRVPSVWGVEQFRRLLKRLTNRKVIAPDADFRSAVSRVVQASQSCTPDEILCLAEPFLYISHLSAMEKYGLTDRSPSSLHVTYPSTRVLAELRLERIARDKIPPDAIRAQLFPSLSSGLQVRKRNVQLHSTSHPWIPAALSEERVRITTIAQTFVDMLLSPALCGGMHHVIQVWESRAGDWVREIVDVVDMCTSSIVKVRAGYILTELLDLDNQRIAGWETYAQRGGSRKLDPDAAYSPQYSERWMLSLNV